MLFAYSPCKPNFDLFQRKKDITTLFGITIMIDENIEDGYIETKMENNDV